MHNTRYDNTITTERLAELEARLNRCEKLDVCAPLEILKLPTGDIIHYVGVPQPPHISQFSKTSNQTITAPSGGSTRERITFNTEDEDDGGANVNGRVTLITTAGSDQGIMEPEPGHYLVSASGLLSVKRASSGFLNDASGTPIKLEAYSEFPFSVGDDIYVVGPIVGNEAAQGVHPIIEKGLSGSDYFIVLGNTQSSGTLVPAGTVGRTTLVPKIPARVRVELRRKPLGGSWSAYRASRMLADFPKVDKTASLYRNFAIPSFEVTAEEGDQFELSIVVYAGEDITIWGTTYAPAENTRITWDHRGA